MGSTIMVSACLAGMHCRYNCSDGYKNSGEIDPKILNVMKNPEITVIICCPELLAGLSMPRPACKIYGKYDKNKIRNGNDVLDGNASVIGIDGNDYTDKFILGAQRAVKIAKDNKVTKAYLKENSPSCGVNKVYSPRDKLVDGIGIFAALLKRNNIEVESI